ncbi:MAG TPA: hypothetical protein VFI88_05795 [Sphingomicrobium sp.]|nr:hypothetical protein [Sphingomicrobium sp.]
MKSGLQLLAITAATLGLAGCGNIGELKPAPGKSLPVKPLMARPTPTPEELLTPPAYANPDRIDELMKKSTPRRADPFDLPPPNGQAQPVPIEELDEDQTVGPETPQ